MVHIFFEFERHLSPSWLQNSSWVLFGRLLVGSLGRLGPTSEHLGSVLVRLSRQNGTKMASKSDQSLVLCQNCSKAENIWAQVGSKISLGRFSGGSWSVPWASLEASCKHPGSVLVRFLRWNGTKMACHSYKSFILCQNYSKAKNYYFSNII